MTMTPEYLSDRKIWLNRTEVLRTEGAVVCGSPKDIAKIILDHHLPVIITDWGVDRFGDPMVEVNVFGKIPDLALLDLGHYGEKGTGEPGNGIKTSQMPDLIRQLMAEHKDLPVKDSLKQFAVSPLEFDAKGSVSLVMVSGKKGYQPGQALYLHDNDRRVNQITREQIVGLNKAANQGDLKSIKAINVLYPTPMDALGCLLLNQIRGVSFSGVSSETPNAALVGSRLYRMLPQDSFVDRTTVNAERFLIASGYNDVSGVFHELHFERGNILKKIVMACIMYATGDLQTSGEMFKKISDINQIMRNREMKGGTHFPIEFFIFSMLRMNQENKGFHELQSTKLDPETDPLSLISGNVQGFGSLVIEYADAKLS